MITPNEARWTSQSIGDGQFQRGGEPARRLVRIGDQCSCGGQRGPSVVRRGDRSKASPTRCRQARMPEYIAIIEAQNARAQCTDRSTPSTVTHRST